MTVLKGQAELDSFKLTKKEVADYLGISTNAVRMSMRGNNYHNLEYRKGPNGFLFKVPARHGVIIDSYTIGPEPRSNKTSTPKITPGSSKVVKRGATHRGEANYTSRALEMSNEAKTIGAIDNKFVDEAHKKAFMDMTEASMEQALKNSRVNKEKEFQRSNKRSFSQDNSRVLNPRSHGKYGGMLNATGMQNIDDKKHRGLARKDEDENGIKLQEKYVDQVQMDGSIKRQLTRINVPDFHERSNSSSFFVGHAKYDDFTSDYDVSRKEVGAEFSQYDLDRHGGPTERTQFKNKIEEDIYRTKKHLLKTRGSWD